MSLEPAGREGVVICQYRRRPNDDSWCLSHRPGYGQAWEADHYTSDGSDAGGDAAMARRCGARVMRRHGSRCAYPRPDDPSNICCR